MSYEYRGSEIVSELIVKNSGKIKQSQDITVRCTRCNNDKQVNYYGHVSNRLKSKSLEYVCHSCIASELTTKRNKNNKGKYIEEIIGEDRGKLSREKRRIYAKENNTGEYFKSKVGLTWEQMYGEEKASLMKKHHKNICKLKPMYGVENYQFGKPAHRLAGKGIKGYYNKIFFRSLTELSFVINYLQQNNLKFVSGELKQYGFKYTYNGRDRNYYCDFVVGNTFYEIKPKALHTHPQNIAKWSAAQQWCCCNNKIFKVLSEKDYQQLSQDNIDLLIKDNIITLL